jgi:hypothetical protein
MVSQSASRTPPRQDDKDPTAADRRLSDEQKNRMRTEPAPPGSNRGDDLPDPTDVGEAG